MNINIKNLFESVDLDSESVRLIENNTISFAKCNEYLNEAYHNYCKERNSIKDKSSIIDYKKRLDDTYDIVKEYYSTINNYKMLFAIRNLYLITNLNLYQIRDELYDLIKNSINMLYYTSTEISISINDNINELLTKYSYNIKADTIESLFDTLFTNDSYSNEEITNYINELLFNRMIRTNGDQYLIDKYFNSFIINKNECIETISVKLSNTFKLSVESVSDNIFGINFSDCENDKLDNYLTEFFMNLLNGIASRTINEINIYLFFIHSFRAYISHIKMYLNDNYSGDKHDIEFTRTIDNLNVIMNKLNNIYEKIVNIINNTNETVDDNYNYFMYKTYGVFNTDYLETILQTNIVLYDNSTGLLVKPNFQDDVTTRFNILNIPKNDVDTLQDEYNYESLCNYTNLFRIDITDIYFGYDSSLLYTKSLFHEYYENSDKDVVVPYMSMINIIDSLYTTNMVVINNKDLSFVSLKALKNIIRRKEDIDFGDCLKKYMDTSNNFVSNTNNFIIENYKTLNSAKGVFYNRSQVMKLLDKLYNFYLSHVWDNIITIQNFLKSEEFRLNSESSSIFYVSDTSSLSDSKTTEDKKEKKPYIKPNCNITVKETNIDKVKDNCNDDKTWSDLINDVIKKILPKEDSKPITMDIFESFIKNCVELINESSEISKKTKEDFLVKTNWIHNLINSSVEHNKTMTSKEINDELFLASIVVDKPIGSEIILYRCPYCDTVLYKNHFDEESGKFVTDKVNVIDNEVTPGLFNVGVCKCTICNGKVRHNI